MLSSINFQRLLYVFKFFVSCYVCRLVFIYGLFGCMKMEEDERWKLKNWRMKKDHLGPPKTIRKVGRMFFILTWNLIFCLFLLLYPFF